MKKRKKERKKERKKGRKKERKKAGSDLPLVSDPGTSGQA